jgi:hypothetical protein
MSQLKLASAVLIFVRWAILPCGIWPAIAYGQPDTHFTEPARFVAFARDADRGIAFEDWRFAADIQSRIGAKYGSVDVVMQQCYSGGFMDDVEGMRRNGQPVPFSFTSAAAFDEIAWSWQNKPQFDFGVWNFSREWRLAARNDATLGMKDLFTTARQKDPFGPVQTNSPIDEHPQYASSGEASDNRKLGDGQQVQSDGSFERRFAVLAAFGNNRTRHAVNIARMKETLVNTFAIPDNRITILYDNYDGVNDVYLPVPAGKINPDDLNQNDPLSGANYTYVNGYNRREDWLAVLDRTGFTVQPQPIDRLLVYTTGIGNYAYYGSTPLKPRDSGRPGVDIPQRDTDAFGQPAPTGGEAEPSANPQMLGDHDDEAMDPGGGFDHIQISLRQPLLGGQSFVFNDQLITDFRLLSANEVFTLPALNDHVPVPTQPYTYEFDVPRALVGMFPNHVALDFDGMTLGEASPDMFVSYSIRAGEQEYVFVNSTVPEPLGVVIVASCIALIASFARRRIAVLV